MRCSKTSFTVSSGSGSSSALSFFFPSALLMAAEVLPPWLEWASSITMANVLPPSFAISSRMKGNFCTVETMIFLPCSIYLRKSPEFSAWPTVAFTCKNCLIVFWIWSSRIRRSVTTMTESKISLPVRLTPISWCASHAMELDLPLPAECWIRYFLPTPCSCTSASVFLTTSSWW